MWFLQVITILRCLYLKQTFDAKWKKLCELEPHEEARKKNGKWVFRNKTLWSENGDGFTLRILRFRVYIYSTVYPSQCWDAKMSTSQLYPTIYNSSSNHSTCYPKCYIHNMHQDSKFHQNQLFTVAARTLKSQFFCPLSYKFKNICSPLPCPRYDRDVATMLRVIREFLKIPETTFTNQEILDVCGVLNVNAHEVNIVKNNHCEQKTEN